MTEVKDYVTSLTPQNKFTNFTGILEKIAGETHRAIKIHRLEEDEWFSFLESQKPHFSRSFGPDDLAEMEPNRYIVKWDQDENTHHIRITILAPRDEIECDDKKVYNSYLKGEWWGPISNLDIQDISEDENPKVQIDFDTTEKWPLLIRGTRPDPFSCYYIALAALDQGQYSVFHEYLSHAALSDCYTAQRDLAMVLLDQEKYEESVHWLARCSLLHQDQICLYVLSKRLLDGKGIRQSAPLAEFILCRLAIQGFVDAFFTLGKLYLKGQDGVEPNRENARMLLEKYIFASQNEDDQDRVMALQLLNEEFPPETEENAESEKTAEKIAEQLNEDLNEKHTIEEKEKNEKEKGKMMTKKEGGYESAIDWALAAGVVAAVSAAGLFAIRRIFRRRH
ncbi:hypothetical protein TRFO_30003 [Tritrichomonas foetus]|uniref:Uncharacterized protein n=1 Tax=Tritrichomonas foetus TaxID=1144522 RepID=A0A1J4JZ36_9EUKA|nr:hypothetical protein TRFO_30003 [Tritrichomonas foetus]|eukprot:OHT02758.1 hypothetical protein TRFO_30003 [Tritrichomonas foetus]